MQRALIGYTNLFRVHTRGTGLMQREFHEYRPHVGPFRKSRSGAMISMATGRIEGYAIAKLQNKGKLFVKVGDEAYEGMVFGECNDSLLDLDCNPCKPPQNDATQTRDAVSWATAGVLNGITRPQFEEALAWIEPDELIEVTPLNIRIRKKILGFKERRQQFRMAKLKNGKH